MKKLILLFLVSALLPAWAQGASVFRFNGQCTLDSTTVSAVPSTPTLVSNGCSVKVLDTGTANLSSICSDGLDPCTAKANPFTADSDGRFFFYALSAGYDIELTGGTPTIGTVTLTGEQIGIEELIKALTDAKRFYDIRSFGATADDATDDDLSEIQAAIDQANSDGGGTVFIPVGTFDVLPSGDATTCIEIKDNVSLLGDGRESIIRAKASAGVYGALFCDKSNAHKHVKFVNFTLDNNIANNLNTAGSTSGIEQHLIRFFGATTQVWVEGMWFYYSGANALHLNNVGVSDLQIRGNYFEYVRDTGGSGHDNTAIYTQGKRVVIDGNTIKGLRVPAGGGTAINGSAVAGIEAHGGPATVSNNQIIETSACLIGVSYSTASAEQDVNDLAFIGNTCDGVGEGIRLVSIDTRNLRNVTVVGNVIDIEQVTWDLNASQGIFLQWLSSGIGGDFENVVISGNTIRFQDSGVGRAGLAESATCAICVNPLGNVNNVLIKGNQVYRAPLRGMRIGNVANSNIKSNIIVRGNTFVDYGQNKLASASFRQGISTEGVLTGLEITDNYFRLTSADEIDVPAISMISESGSTIYTLPCIIRENIGAEVSTLDANAECEFDDTGQKKVHIVSGVTSFVPDDDGTYLDGDLLTENDAFAILHAVTTRGTVGTLAGVTGTIGAASDVIVVNTVPATLKIGEIVEVNASGTLHKILRIVGLSVKTDTTHGAGATGNVLYKDPVVAIAGQGPIQKRHQSVTSSPYNVNDQDFGLSVNAASGAITVNLQDGTANFGRLLFICKIDSTANSVTIDAAGADTINGSATRVLITSDECVLIQSSGTIWRVFALAQKEALFKTHVSITTTPYAVVNTDFGINVNAAAGAAVVDLPDSTTDFGRVLYICKVDGTGNTVTIDAAGSDTINAAGTKVLSTTEHCVQIHSTGGIWRIFGEFGEP